MRQQASPQNIDRVLTALGKLWLENPHQRLGQLLLNLGRSPSGAVDVTRLWNMDEDALLKAIEQGL